jgi:hypothetical protein
VTLEGKLRVISVISRGFEVVVLNKILEFSDQIRALDISRY